ncbi:MAG: hemerythrin domain-containing protein [Candidatus Thermoplasmatota archaeon]
MRPTTILEYMVRDHGKLIKLLTDIEKNLNNDIVHLMRIFDTFEWNLEKHLFTEEKAIFTSYNPVNITKGYAMVPELIKEHNQILNQTRVLRKNLIAKKRTDFDSFKELLTKHKNFEEEHLYPHLDQELDDTQKKLILDRLEEIIS